jgi:RNA-binding protein
VYKIKDFVEFGDMNGYIAIMKNLNSAEKKYIRGLAHELDAVVLIGINGVTETIITAINVHLDANEIIKIRFNKFKEDKKRLCSDIETKTQSQMAGLVGNIAIFYKQNQDPSKQKIKFDSI